MDFSNLRQSTGFFQVVDCDVISVADGVLKNSWHFSAGPGMAPLSLDVSSGDHPLRLLSTDARCAVIIPLQIFRSFVGYRTHNKLNFVNPFRPVGNFTALVGMQGLKGIWA